MDLIQNLVENLVAAKKTDLVTNKRLLRFIQFYVQDGTVKPGLYNLGASGYVSNKPISTPAVDPYIPPQQSYVVNETRPIFGPKMIATSAQPLAQGIINTPSTPPTEEPFGYVDLGTGEDKKSNILYGILIVAILAVLFLCMAKKK